MNPHSHWLFVLSGAEFELYHHRSYGMNGMERRKGGVTTNAASERKVRVRRYLFNLSCRHSSSAAERSNLSLSDGSMTASSLPVPPKR